MAGGVRVRTPRLAATLAILALTAILAWGALLWRLDRAARMQAEADATRGTGLRAEVEARAVQALVEGMSWLFDLAEVRIALADAGDAHLAEIDRRLMAARHPGESLVIQIGVIDPDGVSRWASVAGTTAVDLSDRSHFRVHLDGDHGLFVSAPLQGRVSGRWSVQFSRRVVAADGRFRGVIVLSVDPFRLAEQLGRMLSVSSPGRLVLYRNDGQLLAMVGMDERMLAFRNPRIAQSGTRQDLRVASLFDRSDVFLALRPVPDLPLAVGYTAPAADQLAQYLPARRGRIILFGFGASLILAAAVLGGMLHDRRRQAAQTAADRHHRQQVTRLLEALEAAVFLTAREPEGWRIVAANAGWQRFSAAPGGIGHGPRLDELDFVEPGRLHRFLRDLPAPPASATLDAPLRLADGQLRWVRVRGLLLAPDHAGVEALCSILDIEPEREAAATAIASARLAALGELSASLAHELSQPLTVISLAAEMTALLAAQLPGAAATEIAERNRRIARMVVRARAITDHLRRFAHQDNGEAELTSWHRVMEGSLLLAGTALHDVDARLETAMPEDLPPVWGNQVLLEQVVMNLLVNAAQAVATQPPERRAITLSATVEQGGKWLVVEVRDSGSGIAPEAMPRLFEPFFSTKPPGRGTGLGLSISRRIVAGFGGSIEAANRPEGGAVFTLRLSAEPPPERGAEAPQPSSSTIPS